MNPDRFDPSQSSGKKKKRNISSTKRVAIIIFICAGLLMMFVANAILNSGTKIRSSEPQKLYEPSRQEVSALDEQPSMPPEPPSLGEYETEMRAAVPPLYQAYRRPVAQVADYKKEKHSQRRMAAGSKTAVEGFAGSLGGGQSYAAIRTPSSQTNMELAAAEQEIAQARAREAMVAHNRGQGMGAQPTGVGNTDPNGWDSKDRFLAAGNKLPEGYAPHLRTPQLSQLEIKAGTVIPCVLVSGINSDLPGNSLGQVSENVYDTATGKHLLIPQGAKVVGTYDNRIAYGQSRVLVVWNKLVYPDGSALMLQNLSASDQGGYTGLKGRVNRHWNSIISSALIVSLLGAGVDIVSPTKNDSRDKDDPRTILAENAAREVAEAMSKIIQREADRAPTVVIRPGSRFLLFVRQDMIFAEAWR